MLESEVQDLVLFTRPEEGKGNLEQIAQNYTHYPLVGTLVMGPDRIKVDASHLIEKRLMLSTADAAQVVEPWQDDNVAVGDYATKLSVEYRRAQTNFAFEEEEVSVNKGEEKKIYDLMQEKRGAAELDMIELMEREGWAAPSASTDRLHFLGIPYWVVKNATTGFTGLAPTGWTLVGGINPSTVPHWRNYSATYTTPDALDLLPKWRTAKRATNFRNVTTLEGYRYMKKTVRHYCNETTLSALESLAEGRNENLGQDMQPYNGATGTGTMGVANFDGDITFARTPIIYVQHLDSDTQNPIYGLSHDKLAFHVARSMDMKESPAIRHPRKSMVWVVFKRLKGQFCCVNRRQQYVLYINN